MSETPKTEIIPSRQLVIHVMLSMLAAIGVFVVLSVTVVVPQMARQEKRIRDLESQVAQLQASAEEPAAAEPEAAPSAAAQTTPAVAK